LYHKELVALADSFGLKTATTKTIVTALNVPDNIDVLFLLSVPNTLKDMLLASAILLVYTPSNEHFGIVPLEAMLAEVPVLAANTGGPLETIVHGQTGWLCSPSDIESWTIVMNNVLHELPKKELKAIGAAGKRRVKTEFSDVKMAERLDKIISEMAETPRRSSKQLTAFLLTILVTVIDTVYFLISQSEILSKIVAEIPWPPLIVSTISTAVWLGYFIIGYTRSVTRPEDAMKSI
jgi:alpha-1,3/alpha-1,6-mannosyltransferase